MMPMTPARSLHLPVRTARWAGAAMISALGALPIEAQMRPSNVSLSGVPVLTSLVSRPESELRAVVERYGADRTSLFRKYDAAGSPDQRFRARKFYAGWGARLKEIDFDRLSQEGKADYVLLSNELRHEVALLDRAAKEAREAAPLLPFVDSLLAMQDARRRLETVNSPGAARTLARTAALADSLRAVLEGRGAAGAKAPDVSKVVAMQAAQRIEEVRGIMAGWYRFYDGYDPIFTWWTRDPWKKADDALKAYTKAIRERVVGWREGTPEPIVGLPIGAEGLKADLAYEMIPYTPEELIMIAKQEQAWSFAEIKKASRQMGFGDDWHKAVEKVKQAYVEPGKQPDLIRDLAQRAKDFFAGKNYVTIPELADEDWRMEMLSPERQRVAPFFLGGELILVAYPTDGMTEDEKQMSLRGNNPHFSNAVVFHELNPGHHLQGFMAARYNTHRRAFGTPFWNEGNALYWEMFLWDQGFHQTPEDKVGALVWRLHRSARIIFSLSFHLGKMTPAEAIDYLVENVGFERANAEGEVRRSFNGSYPPLYQMAYMIGGIQQRALRKELVETGKMTNAQFHDGILRGGPMPVEMMRARMLNLPLTRDYTTKWKFAGEVSPVQ
jgi:hypothetical protein